MCRKTVTPRSGTKVLRAEELYDLSLSPGEKADLLQYIANAEARAGKEITIRVGQTDGDVELDYFLRRVTVSEETLRISAVSDLLPFVLFRCKLILDYDQMMDIDAQLCKGKQVQQEELLLASYMAEYMLGTNTADEITSADDYVQMRVDTILSLVFDETIHL